jgi:HK97 family phage portal protein
MPSPFLLEARPAIKTGAVTMSAIDWKTMFGDKPRDTTLDEHGAYMAVAWVSRCLEMRCNALAAIPAVVYPGMSDKAIEWEFADALPQMLWMIEADLQLYGAAYWLRERNLVKDKGFRRLHPSTITPKFSAETGLTHFERKVNGKTVNLSPDELLYFWSPNLEAETGPGKGWVSRVLAESDVAHNINQFAAGFFERGAIMATVLSVEGNPGDKELDRLEAWWKRMLHGVRKAFETVAVRAIVKPVPVGSPPADLAMSDLTLRVREQIATAAGVPQTMLEDAANYATATEHHQAFYTETVVPEALRIQAVYNAQLFKPQALRLDLDYHALDIFQEDEAERAAALQQLVGAGVPLDIAMQMLGMELPGEMTYDELVARKEQEQEQAFQRQQQLAATARPDARGEMRRWQSKALKALRAGKSAQVEFETDDIDADAQAVIRDRLALARDEGEVKAAFVPPFRCQHESQTYP